jgi:hypothetical protein
MIDEEDLLWELAQAIIQVKKSRNMPSANERPRGTVNMTHSQVQKLKSQGNL